jgi:acetyl-CoA/propionyl-CoA carboxylase biotin carboxyl carrier protein
MLGKVIAWGPDRATALRRLDRALAGTVVLGVTTNTAFLRALLADPDVQAGRLDTGLAERIVGNGSAGGPAAPASAPGPGGHEAPDAGPLSISRYFTSQESEALAAAALVRVLLREPAGPVTDPWDIPDGWRPGAPAWTRFRLAHGPGPETEVRVRGLASAGAEVIVGDGAPVTTRAEFRQATSDGGADLILIQGTRTARFAYAAEGDTIWLGRNGHAWAVTEAAPAPLRGSRAAAADGTVRSPMPGTVVTVHVNVGQDVSAGQPVLVVEAMKMEHTVTAPLDGTVSELTAKAGQQVRMDEPLAVIEPGKIGVTADAQLQA